MRVKRTRKRRNGIGMFSPLFDWIIELPRYIFFELPLKIVFLPFRIFYIFFSSFFSLIWDWVIVPLCEELVMLPVRIILFPLKIIAKLFGLD